MKEIPALLNAWDRLRDAGDEAVLATVVKVEGSSYRSPGARMLIDPHGANIGTISGGCLESHVVKRAWWLTERARATVCRYDTSADEDTQWAFGLGCNGVVHVLLERLSAGTDAQIEALRRAREEMRPAATAVVIAARCCNVAVGERLVVFPDGSRDGRLGNAVLAGKVDRDLDDVLREKRSGCRTYAVDGGAVEVFLEVLAPPPRLVVFGAGHDAVPVVRFAKELGWHVTVADGRAHYARRDRFPDADALRVTMPCDPLDGCGVSADSAVVVMTHSVDQDRELLRRLLRERPCYIGQLGPRSRTERLLDEIRSGDPSGVPLFVDTLHYPIGLDIGAENPEEIALAIVSEIRAALAGRTGAKLRHLGGTIHTGMSMVCSTLN